MTLPGALPVGRAGAQSLGEGLRGRVRVETLRLAHAAGAATTVSLAALRSAASADLAETRLGPAACVVAACVARDNAALTAIDASGNRSLGESDDVDRRYGLEALLDLAHASGLVSLNLLRSLDAASAERACRAAPARTSLCGFGPGEGWTLRAARRGLSDADARLVGRELRRSRRGAVGRFFFRSRPGRASPRRAAPVATEFPRRSVAAIHQRDIRAANISAPGNIDRIINNRVGAQAGRVADRALARGQSHYRTRRRLPGAGPPRPGPLRADVDDSRSAGYALRRRWRGSARRRFARGC